MSHAPGIDLSRTIANSLYGEIGVSEIRNAGQGGLPSWFDVTGLAVASIGQACAEIAALNGSRAHTDLVIDPALASAWFGMTIRPQDWQMPPIWDEIAGLYETTDGWIRLHTNAAHHRRAALAVLACAPNRDAVQQAVSSWTATDLETAIVSAGGCAAQMRSFADWKVHPQGRAVLSEPLIDWAETSQTKPNAWRSDAEHPLAGLKVLDCTRVLAGPVCTRFLAGFGAEVLRIDPPGWAEHNIVPEITRGKRLTTLDLKTQDGKALFWALLKEADIFVHGYRADALEQLGLGANARKAANADLIDITLNAYGWTGPWATRRGYDSLVQMSSGIAELGMRRSGSGVPTPLPVQALDHAAGYLLAASAVRALNLRQSEGRILTAKLSLARTAGLLAETLSPDQPDALRSLTEADLIEQTEDTDWGPAKRVKFPCVSGLAAPQWDIPARNLHADPAEWLAR